jgi:hypothetical protein
MKNTLNEVQECILLELTSVPQGLTRDALINKLWFYSKSRVSANLVALIKGKQVYSKEAKAKNGKIFTIYQAS